jgi:hypothetical protein
MSLMQLDQDDNHTRACGPSRRLNRVLNFFGQSATDEPVANRQGVKAFRLAISLNFGSLPFATLR